VSEGVSVDVAPCLARMTDEGCGEMCRGDGEGGDGWVVVVVVVVVVLFVSQPASQPARDEQHGRLEARRPMMMRVCPPPSHTETPPVDFDARPPAQSQSINQ
jgi:hypothetical protein